MRVSSASEKSLSPYSKVSCVNTMSGVSGNTSSNVGTVSVGASGSVTAESTGTEGSASVGLPGTFTVSTVGAAGAVGSTELGGEGKEISGAASAKFGIVGSVTSSMLKLAGAEPGFVGLTYVRLDGRSGWSCRAS